MKSIAKGLITLVSAAVMVVTSACAVPSQASSIGQGQRGPAASTAPRLYESEIIRQAVAAHQAAAATPGPRLYESEIIRQALAAHQAAAATPAPRLYESEIIRQALAAHQGAAAAPTQRLYESEIVREAVAARQAASPGLGTWLATQREAELAPSTLPGAGGSSPAATMRSSALPGAASGGSPASTLAEPAVDAAVAPGAEERTAGTEACSAGGKSWTLPSAAAFRLPRPPDGAATQAEIEQLRTLAAQRDAKALQQIAFWDAGSPSYRWVQTALNQLEAKPLSSPQTARGMALMNVAIYDALVVACDSEAVYGRPHPSQVDRSLSAVVAIPQGPSYPSEHAVVAGAAAAILTYLYPADAKTFSDMARQAAQSRLLAGVAFPSDVKAGLELGQAVAQKVIERARADGSGVTWTGSVPSGPGFWNGTKPIEPLAGTWKTWVLTSGSELRPPAPPAYDSPQNRAELQAIKTFTRTFTSNAKAMYWQTFDGIWRTWYDTASLRLFEHRLDRDSLRAARDYAAMSVAHYDAIVACWDAKYAYWAIRPFQLDPTLVTLFPTPNHPSYPAAHGCASGAISGVMEYLYPAEAQTVHARADEAASSRMWAGIHFQSDIDAGLALGRAVARKVIDRIMPDK